jgi:hypothetical protein
MIGASKWIEITDEKIVCQNLNSKIIFILGRKEYLSSVNSLHSDFSPRASFLYSCSISSNYDVPRTLKIIRHDFDLKKERENHFHLGLELSLGDDRQI